MEKDDLGTIPTKDITYSYVAIEVHETTSMSINWF